MSTENKEKESEAQDVDHTQDIDSPTTDAEDTETTDDASPTEKGDNKDHLLTELQKKHDTVNDKYLRLYSEFENYRRRTAKEKLENSRAVSAEILKSFLSVVDDFDRAIAGNDNDNDIESIKEGFKLIHQKMMHLMESKGVKPMNSMEQAFDTEYHEAITNIPAPNESLKGKVVDVAEKGYFYHDQVLRYAKVVVGQ